jgi:hypothetical protein
LRRPKRQARVSTGRAAGRRKKVDWTNPQTAVHGYGEWRERGGRGARAATRGRRGGGAYGLSGLPLTNRDSWASRLAASPCMDGGGKEAYQSLSGFAQPRAYGPRRRRVAGRRRFRLVSRLLMTYPAAPGLARRGALLTWRPSPAVPDHTRGTGQGNARSAVQSVRDNLVGPHAGGERGPAPPTGGDSARASPGGGGG